MKAHFQVASDVAFSPAVKAVQQRKGSRPAYARMEAAGGWQTRITPELAAFIGRQDSVFLATASAAGQPYVQHRGGPPGFLRVLDESSIAFSDFAGNRQYITIGNLGENPKAQLFLLDYAERRRIKIWGEARVIEDDAELTARLMPSGYKARASQVIVFSVMAWDENCPQHIPRRVSVDEAAVLVAERDARIAELESVIQALRTGALTSSGPRFSAASQ